MRGKAIVAGVAVAALALAGCSSSSKPSSSSASASASASGPSSSSAASKEPFRITDIASLSGYLAPYVTNLTASLKAAVTEINAEGGILGRQVQLTTVDDASDPTQAVTAAQKVLAESTKPDVVIPGDASTVSLPLLPLFAKAKIPTVSLATAAEANNPTKFPYNFGVTQTDASTLKALVQHLKDTKVTKIALLGTNDATGQSAIALIKGYAKTDGITITGTQALAQTSVDTTAAQSALKASNPQTLLVLGLSGPIVGSIFKDRVKLGWDVPTITDVTTTANNLVALSGGLKVLHNVVEEEAPYAVQGDPLQSTPAFKKYLTGFRKLVPHNLNPLASNCAGWAAGAFIAAVFDKAGSTDPAAYQKAAYALTTTDAPLWFQTASGSFGLTPTNHYISYTDFDFVPANNRNADGSLIKS